MMPSLRFCGSLIPTLMWHTGSSNGFPKPTLRGSSPGSTTSCFTFWGPMVLFLSPLSCSVLRSCRYHRRQCSQHLHSRLIEDPLDLIVLVATIVFSNFNIYVFPVTAALTLTHSGGHDLNVDTLFGDGSYIVPM
ncbi:hypothetical protein RJT34_04436 [Clitoria ternatea]|uniref:Uncharacterized protein n=1 Tax=Clitoria ternatea TaxID=43366 RepID=A0AAN9KMN3_CLITE